jgi:hypothetical protein
MKLTQLSSKIEKMEKHLNLFYKNLKSSNDVKSVINLQRDLSKLKKEYFNASIEIKVKVEHEDTTKTITLFEAEKELEVRGKLLETPLMLQVGSSLRDELISDFIELEQVIKKGISSYDENSKAAKRQKKTSEGDGEQNNNP